MNKKELKSFLDYKVEEYNNPRFIETDPIQIPHKFSLKEDIEIAGFLTATIAWGNRKSILTNASRLMDLLDNSPYDFIMNHREDDLISLENFVHRTFNGIDLQFFVSSLQNIYNNHGGLENIFTQFAATNNLQGSIHEFKTIFFELPHLPRTQKHVSDPYKNSAAKRINMFLRWMVRKDGANVDFGIWEKLKPSQLSCPLDVHSGNTARKLGLLSRKQNDAKALQDLDKSLRKLDAADPVKYDFALFGLGVFEKY
ncbi:TIGR02757 family protein [Antarcticibacterium arcticum]|uniref:TIGR02757 family protein n=1 Tax=Antarcticibacterium arcticum TaxID=2585771 RepID=A0A5B8YH66_9FLAO|nr:TIGR02757 family protein [Antarcticibacterium arcticum]QED37104.1 TIGR02757 family protein [Antarcticibacterium arcticum]